MFILILYGYRQSKIFAIDCLAATLIDSIWATAMKEINMNLKAKEDLLGKEKISHQKKIARLESRVGEIDKSIKDEEDKLNGERGITPGDKKKDKAPPPPKPAAKKGGKDQVPSNPLEAEKFEIQKEIEKSKEAVVKYDDKLAKLKIVQVKNAEIEANDKLVVELFDKQGERKFVKTKLDSIANTFLTDKNTYVLGYYAPPLANEEEQVVPLEIEGYCLRTIEEDETAVDEPLIPKKDDKKKGKKGK